MFSRDWDIVFLFELEFDNTFKQNAFHFSLHGPQRLAKTSMKFLIEALHC